MKCKLAVFLTLVLMCVPVFSMTTSLPQWQTLPATPELPKSNNSGYTAINGVQIWYALYGKGQPVILLHGGLANSNYWGNLIPVLDKKYKVIVMDSRCHGRSSCDQQKITYSLMASDVLGLMDKIHLQKAAIVGWSDGADIGLDLAIHHPERVSKLFAFAANSNPNGSNDVSKNPIFIAYMTRAQQEYQQLSPTPKDYPAFLKQIEQMWATQPNFIPKQLQAIKVPVWIADADHDEAIKPEDTAYMAKTIPESGLLIEPEVSHFAFLQDPEQFNVDVLHFLEHAKWQ